MPKLNGTDRDTINYRPVINFVEPEASDEPLSGLKEPEADIPSANEQLDKLDKLALAGELLSDAIQLRVDDRVGDFAVKLDPSVDKNIIDALKRRFGTEAPEITFDQYRQCRAGMREKAVAKAEELEPSDDDIKDGRINPAGPLPLSIATAEAKGGLLRPELQKSLQVVEPLDLDEFQEDMECLLMNVLWKRFIKKVLMVVIPFPLNLLLPDEIC